LSKKAGTITGTTDVAGNFAKFIGYSRCLGEGFGAAEAWSRDERIQPLSLQILCRSSRTLWSAQPPIVLLLPSVRARIDPAPAGASGMIPAFRAEPPQLRDFYRESCYDTAPPAAAARRDHLDR
jgi:hypothetical protein